ncbi:MAG: sterol desaturase family protein [Alphaproteobacteria bacterium]|nr:sterol desaturase family protein [Alphaproteobacteria bacterium]
MSFPDVIAYAVPAFVLLIILEMFVVRRSGRGRYETKDTFSSLAMGFGNNLIAVIGAGALVYMMYSWVYQFRLIEAMPIVWWTILICVIVDDFAYYWFHRIAHERRWFWASHVIHHSSQHYNLSTALRQTWTGKLSFAGIFWLPLALIGFPPPLVLFVGGVNLVYQFWIHTELINRMGPFEWVFNTPSHHRVHHATNPRYLDANYAGMLIIWDRMFGTYVAEDEAEKPRYGIIKNLTTFNPLRIGFHEWIGLAKDLRSARSLREVGGYLWGPPGWSPDGSRMTSAMIKQRWQRLHPVAGDPADGPAPKPGPQPAE